MRLDNRPVTVFATHPTPKGVVAVGFFDDNGDPFERPWTALREEPIRSYDDIGWTKTNPEHPGTIAVFTGAPKPPPEPWGEWVKFVDPVWGTVMKRYRRFGTESQFALRESDGCVWKWFGHSGSVWTGRGFADLDAARAACEAYTLSVEGAPAPTEVK